MDVSVVQAGGGCRTLWGAGVLVGLGDALPPIRERAGVSAGSAMAVGGATGRMELAIDRFMARARNNRRNVHLFAPLRGKNPFPHEEIYRDVIRTSLESGGFEALKKASPVRIGLVSVRPGFPLLRTAWQAFRQFSAFEATQALHGRPAPMPGLEWRVATAGDAPDIATLVDWIIASSASPPVTQAPRIDGRIHLDAGLVENVPIRALSPAAQRGPILVVLARPQVHGQVLEDGNRLYLAPADWPPLRRWDYTRPDLARATWEQGQRDGRALAERVATFFHELAH